MSKEEKKVQAKKYGNWLKIQIIKKGFPNQKAFAVFAGIPYNSIRDYTCGKFLASEKTKAVIKAALSSPNPEVVISE